MATPKWQELAARLAKEIDAGATYPAGSALPKITDMVKSGAGSISTVSSAYKYLVDNGYAVVINEGRHGRNGTFVRDRSVVRVPVSRYGQVLQPGGTRGPWETATAEQGLDGRMEALGIARMEAPDSVAAKLDLDSNSRMVVCRHRHAMIGEDVVQVQRAWYPEDVAVAAGLDAPGKIQGGVFGALNEAGMLPEAADERITARRPTKEEAAELSIGTGVPVLKIERIARDQAGRPVELLCVLGAADRIELVYDSLPIRGIA